MNIARLNRRIRLQRRESAKDDEGIVTEGWADVATVWAAIEPLRGREYFAAATVNAENTVRIRMRYRRGITPDMRVLYDGRVFEIQSVIDVNEMHREIHLMTQEVVGDGETGNTGDATPAG
ncbi:phage head closure protein [Aneurinibacillus thermoaerophilus]|uniref:phage head closure protein n=1 Tax=Aneurinibacillus thermoaerophilus TaxID=143495 RepID=UPI002E2493C7|nr:phage head closure protein [Aneurinibacillus thermoaerophilus]MED0676983.1 phage head closure protein [Aneurinibacillus thermoaerophilus]